MISKAQNVWWFNLDPGFFCSFTTQVRNGQVCSQDLSRSHLTNPIRAGWFQPQSLERCSRSKKVNPTCLNAWKACLNVCGSWVSNPVCFLLILQVSSQDNHGKKEAKIDNRYGQVLLALWRCHLRCFLAKFLKQKELCSTWSASDLLLINKLTGSRSISGTAEYVQLPHVCMEALASSHQHRSDRAVPRAASLGISKFKAGARNFGEKICRRWRTCKFVN